MWNQPSLRTRPNCDVLSWGGGRKLHDKDSLCVWRSAEHHPSSGGEELSILPKKAMKNNRSIKMVQEWSACSEAVTECAMVTTFRAVQTRPRWHGSRSFFALLCVCYLTMTLLESILPKTKHSVKIFLLPTGSPTLGWFSSRVTGGN